MPESRRKDVYEDIVDEIDALIDAGDFEKAEEKLQWLYAYKPVRVSWAAKKARLLIEQKKYREFFPALSGKYSLTEYDPSVKEIIGYCARHREELKDLVDMRRYQFLGDYLGKHGPARLQKTADEEANFLGLEEPVLSDAVRLRNAYLENALYLEVFITDIFCMKIKGDTPFAPILWAKNSPNFGFMNEQLNKADSLSFIIIKTERDTSADVFAKILKALGKTPIVIDDGSDDEIFRKLQETIDEKSCGIILAENAVLERLSKLRDGEFIVERLYGRIDYPDALTFGFCGSYISYISSLYLCDCRELLERKPSKRFSVVIPARNSSDTLRYALRTCMEQSFSGEYEIIVSDNSTGGNPDVFSLCEEINDSRIVYLKTPRDFSLSKSFEFAFLHASGEYVFGLGSDDGLLPWALSALDMIVSSAPDEQVIRWQRGFYAWPGFNGGQQGQMIIPGGFEPGNIGGGYVSSTECLSYPLSDTGYMYDMPMLYINSCFRRDFMQTLVEKTGRLWDGVCQDIYMGVVVPCVLDHFPGINYPLSIAGMSPRSEGARANRGSDSDKAYKEKIGRIVADNNAGAFCMTGTERLLPFVFTDVDSFYDSVLKVIHFGLLSKESLTDVLDFKKIFRDIYSKLDVKDVAYDLKLHDMRAAAGRHGEDFLKWFDAEIYDNAFEEVVFDEEKLKGIRLEKSYAEGTGPDGSITLDASKYGVQNIHDAVQLFAKIVNDSQ